MTENPESDYLDEPVIGENPDLGDFREAAEENLNRITRRFAKGLRPGHMVAGYFDRDDPVGGLKRHWHEHKKVDTTLYTVAGLLAIAAALGVRHKIKKSK